MAIGGEDCDPQGKGFESEAGGGADVYGRWGEGGEGIGG